MPIVDEELLEVLQSAVPLFKSICPSLIDSIGHKGFRTVRKILRNCQEVLFFKSVMEGNPDRIPERLGELAGRRIAHTLMIKPLKRMNINAHKRMAGIDRTAGHAGHGRNRSWITEFDKGLDGRIVKRMVMVFHDANHAGKHVDLHIGHLSLVFRISGKPVENELKFKDGMLTQDSKNAILKHLKAEIANGSRVPQNLDHDWQAARFQWINGSAGDDRYGAGKTRQIVAEDDIEIVQANDGAGQTLKMYAPILDKHCQLYLHKLYPGSQTKAPIVIFGRYEGDSPEFEPRLHLKSMNSNELERFKLLVDPKTVTLKEDGASTYFVISSKGSRFFSPRMSKETGSPIEYTGKLPELARVKRDGLIIGMGELKFKQGGVDLTAAQIGGVLNSDKIRPRNIRPEIRIYRIDEIDKKQVSGLSFSENRKIQERVASLHGQFKVVKKVDPKIQDGVEGLVGVPEGKSINEGIKIKFLGNPADWQVESVDLKNGPTGRTAGVVWFKSLESGKRFKLGPGQLGGEEFVRSIMVNPDGFVGRVFKVNSKRGHEGRAAKLVEEHLDKGVV
jgi:hypothetical protein